jgi:Arm DNA-binding domain/Phage integrase central domain
MRTKLTPAFCQKAPAEQGAERSVYWDVDMPGFGLVVTASGHRSFVVQYRAGGRSRRMKIAGVLGLSGARKRAKILLGEVAHDRDPLQERRKAAARTEDTFQKIAENYLAREGRALRTANQRRAMLDRLVHARLGARHIDDIRRSDIVKLLDEIEDTNGPVMADRTFATIRRVMNWHASRSDEFRSPIVRGMARTKGKERARARILTDDELRAVWKAADATPGPFGALVQFLLLTAARRTEASEMIRDEIEGTDWTLPEARNKVKVDLVRPLSPAAQDVLAKLPRIGRAGYIFTTDGRSAIGGYSKFKRKLDRKVLDELGKIGEGRNDKVLLARIAQVEELMARIAKAKGAEKKRLARELNAIWWTLHDLRRTARSLMSRVGIDSDHAERCLGHVIGGVRGVYDRHEFHAEKKRAYEALASQVDRIVNPKENVVPLHGRVPGADHAEPAQPKLWNDKRNSAATT